MLLLADLTVRVTMAMVTTAAVAWMLRRSSSGTRALVWSAGIVATLLLPLLSVLVPAWEVPLLPAVATSSTSAGPPSAPAPRQTAPSWQTPPWSLETDTEVAGDGRGTELPPMGERSAERVVVDATSVYRPPAIGSQPEAIGLPTNGIQAHRAELLLVAWATGAAILFGQLIAGLGRVVWIERGSRPVTGGPLHARLHDAARRLGIRQRVLLLQSDRIAVPVTWQLWSPRVLVPSGMQRWSTDCQTAVLLHELAHVRRRDYATQLIAHLAVSVYWFNPLVWMARRRLHREREHACDDVVLHAGFRPSTYAAHLVEVARTMHHASQPGVAIALLRSTRLRQWVQAILDPNAGRTSPNRRTIVSLATASLALIVPLAALQPVATEAAAPTPSATPASAQLVPTLKLRSELQSTPAAPRAVQQPAAPAPVPVEKAVIGQATIGDAVIRHAPAERTAPGPTPFGSVPFSATPFGGWSAAQEPRPSIDQLIKMRIHGISAEFIDEMSNLFGAGLDIEQLVKLRIHGVSGEFARDMRSSFGAEMQMQDLITARIHGVSAEFAGRMSTLLGASLDFEQLKKMRIHGVGPELVEEMTDLLGSQPDVDALIKLRIHGVSGSYASELRAAFGADLGLDELVAARIHGISPEFAAAMSSSLAEELSFETLKRMRIHGVSAALVQELREAGYDDLTAKDLIDIRIHGMERILRKRSGAQQ